MRIMPRIETSHLGTVEYNDEDVLDFPEGLPAFVHDTRFVLVERSESAPLIFMQSLVSLELCFLTAPVVTVDANYTLRTPLEELAPIGVDEVRLDDLLCLVILTIPGDRPPTANLMAPVVIHRKTRLARQVIQYESGYSFQHVLNPVKEDEC
jgi:flagellar assembly factor FliW